MSKARQETIKVKTFTDKGAFAVISYISYTGTVRFYGCAQNKIDHDTEAFRLLHPELINKVKSFLNKEDLNYMKPVGL